MPRPKLVCHEISYLSSAKEIGVQVTPARQRVACLFAAVALALIPFLVQPAVVQAAMTQEKAAQEEAAQEEAAPSEDTADDGYPVPVAPPRPDGEGEGPFGQLILRGPTLINGTGAPPIGPVDIVIEGNRIVDIEVVGYPGIEPDAEERPELAENGREIDLSGHYVLPGFVDMHGHLGGEDQQTPAEYVLKLWLGHGITTVRDPGCGIGLDFCLEHKRKSASNEITAPRLHAYVVFGQEREEPFTQPEQARAWIDAKAKEGADGFKFFGYRPDIMRAAIERISELGLRSACHHAQIDVARVNVLDTASWGLDTMEHWYGLPEALFTDRTVQDYPLDYNYQNEQHRFGEAGRLWQQAAERGSEQWDMVIEELLERDFTLVPTLTIYEASRDLMRARRAEWHELYTLPALWDFYRPSRKAHGSYWFYWTTEDEVAWRLNFRKWMDFLVDYKNRGGRVAAGSDSGFIYKLYGFGYVRELELLREAGFHPLEVIRSATMKGAEALGVADSVGSIEPGKLADLVVIERNPLQNFKVLYGTGALEVDADNVPRRVGGVKYTIKDGIVYDAQKLLADVRAIVQQAKDDADRPQLIQPGLDGDEPNLAAARDQVEADAETANHR